MERKLYTFLTNEDASHIEEFGWVGDTKFYVWVPHLWLFEFVEGLKEIFGYDLFDDGGIKVNMQIDCTCIDLCELLGGYLNIEEVFPKSQYQR
jgi:hypothetical protein